MTHRHVTRICAACRQDVAIADQYCPACGADTQSAIIAEESHSLRQKTAHVLPLVLTLGVATLRIAFRLGQATWFRQALSHWLRGSDVRNPIHNTPTLSPSKQGKPGRRIHIRSRWVVRDTQGHEQQGTEEHLIDIV